MRFEGKDPISNDIIEKALNSYYFETSNFRDKQKINQYKYIKENGEFSIETEKTDTHLNCILYINNKEYSCSIPLHYDEIISNVYPYGETVYENVNLISVAFKDDFPWTKEAFVTSYWGTPTQNEDLIESGSNSNILLQYYVPRKASNPPESTANYGNEFKTLDINIYTHANKPNPWAFASMFVLYEDDELADRVLNSDSVHLSKQEYQKTPPENMMD